MKIFIDHFPDEDETSRQLSIRIKQLNKDVKVISFLDMRSNQDRPTTDPDQQTLELIEDSDIIIPLISPSYLSQTPNNITKRLNELSDKKEISIFPFICKKSNWSSRNWIVRSKVFPEGGIPLNELNVDDREKAISDLLQTLENIIYNSPIPQMELEVKTIKKNDKIVFISHDHDDADFAELLKLQFEKYKIIAWLGNERLKIGQDWREEIDEGISKSIAIIVIMSPEAKKSEYVTYEWAYAWGKGKKIFPIMLKQTTLHPRLESLQYLDFKNRATRPWDELINSIKLLI